MGALSCYNTVSLAVSHSGQLVWGSATLHARFLLKTFFVNFEKELVHSLLVLFTRLILVSFFTANILFDSDELLLSEYVITS
jgi:hypothetical protein